MSKISVLYLITSTDVGGTESFLSRLVTNLDKDIFKLSVVSILPLGKIGLELREKGIEVLSLEMKNKLHIIAGIIRLLSIIKRIRPDILHAFLFHANLLARLVGKLLMKVAIVISSERTMEMEGILRLLTNHLTINLTDGVIAVSPAVAHFLKEKIKLNTSKLFVIPTGIEVDKFSSKIDTDLKSKFGLPPSYKVIGSIGRWEKVKGFPYLIKALSELKKENTAALLLGYGSQETLLKRMINKLHPHIPIILTHLNMPVYSALQAIDIFVLPSLYEGLPNVLLEAGAAAKPIVATRVGGIPDLIEDKRHGLLTPPKDPRALRDAIITLLEDENYATLLGKAIQKRVREEFSLTSSVEKYSQLYLNFYDKIKKYASEYNR